MIAPTEGSVILNIGGEVEGQIVTNKQGVMTVITDVAGEGGGGGGALWVSSDDNVGVLDKTYTEIKTALDQGKMVYLKAVHMENTGTTTSVFSLSSIYENATTPAYSAFFIGNGDEAYFVSSSPDGEMHYYEAGGYDDGQSS